MSSQSSSFTIMQKLLKWIMPALFLGLCMAIAAIMMVTKPEPPRRSPPNSIITVDATILKRETYQVIIPSQGIIQARTRSMLIPEVSGEIIWISDSFRSGGFFGPGDELVKIDQRDYQTSLVVAKASLAQRTSAYEIEQAQHEQAKINWERLGNGKKPTRLVLREPQLAEARALMQSAAAGVERAERDLNRTVIKAPYEGRILNKSVDIGQSVSPGTMLAEIFATDYVEIRLPLRNEHLDFIELPEAYDNEESSMTNIQPEVQLTGNYGSRNINWTGSVVRAQGAYDPRSRELFVIAQVKDPYKQTDRSQPPLKINQFVQAQIQGKRLEDVYVIPRSALRINDEVILIDKENRIFRKPVEIILKQGEEVIVKSGLQQDDLLCLTPLLFAADGAKVRPVINGKALPPPDGKGRPVKQGDGRKLETRTKTP